MREYSEEYLGNPEREGDGRPIDYENEAHSARSMTHAEPGRFACSASDVFTVVVFGADVFDAIFEEMVEQNDEGDFVVVAMTARSSPRPANHRASDVNAAHRTERCSMPPPRAAAPRVDLGRS